jgi:hypothetical protein
MTRPLVMLACSSMDFGLTEVQMSLLLLGFFLWVPGVVLLFANIFLISAARSHRTGHWRWFCLSLVWAVAFCSGLLPGQALGSGGPHNLFIFYTLATPTLVIGQFAVLLAQRIRARRKARAFQALSSDDSCSSVADSGQHDPLAS